MRAGKKTKITATSIWMIRAGTAQILVMMILVGILLTYSNDNDGMIMMMMMIVILFQNSNNVITFLRFLTKRIVQSLLFIYFILKFQVV